LKRTLEDFFGKELHFEHLRTIYRHFLGPGGYERAEMVQALAEHLSGEGAKNLAEELSDDDVELLYVLRQVGGLAPESWLFRELENRTDTDEDTWETTFHGLRRRHVTFRIGRDTAYLPEGLSDVIGKAISGQPRRRKSTVMPGASVVRQSRQGLVIALLNRVHQMPPRVMAEEERIWKRDLEAMAEHFQTYLYEAADGQGSLPQIRGRVSRLVELLRKMGFLEKRGKRLYIDPENWTDWSTRPEIERQSIFLSFLRDHYENIPVVLEALVDWKDARWVPVERLTEAVRYRTLRSAFHVLRVRPQAEVSARDPGPRWVTACIHLLADLGLVYTGTDEKDRSAACVTEGGLAAWTMLHTAGARRRRKKDPEDPRAFAQPNFELLIPEESSAALHRRVGAVAELRSLDRFWTYVLTPQSVARGVEEGLDRDSVLRTLDDLVEGALPSNVREAVAGWAETAWWVDADGQGEYLRAEPGLFRELTEADGIADRFEARGDALRPLVPRPDAARWLEERGIRVVEEDRDPPGELGRSAAEQYHKILDAWQRRMEHGGEGTPAGSYWDDVVPVEPFTETGAKR